MRRLWLGRAIRVALTASGIALLVIGLAADYLHLGLPAGFGVGQFLMSAFGVSLVLAAILWHRFVHAYKTAAVILLNTLVLIGCLELLAIAVMRGLQMKQTELGLSYYKSRQWSVDYWAEARRAESYRYEPFTGWRHRSFQGDWINVNSEGLRVTPGSDCSPGAFTLFTFGGSTMWGWGAPDDKTIPAYLQRELEPILDSNLCIKNLAEDAFVSTQSLFQLLRELQAGRVPKAVVFYDGVNDVFAAFETGRAGVHPQLEQIAARFEQQENPLAHWVRTTRLCSLIQRLIHGRALLERGTARTVKNYKSLGLDENSLADSVAVSYFAVYRMVQAMGGEYGFSHFFFWQPQLAVSEKSLTAEERLMYANLNRDLIALAQATQSRISMGAEKREFMWSLEDAFDDRAGLVWIDDWGHLTPEGNRLIADRILAAMKVSKFKQ